MRKPYVIPETIDATDESLMRWHYTNIAQDLGVDRRTAEVHFRSDWDHIEIMGESPKREHVFTVMIRLINSKELS